MASTSSLSFTITVNDPRLLESATSPADLAGSQFQQISTTTMTRPATSGRSARNVSTGTDDGGAFRDFPQETDHPDERYSVVDYDDWLAFSRGSSDSFPRDYQGYYFGKLERGLNHGSKAAGSKDPPPRGPSDSDKPRGLFKGATAKDKAVVCAGDQDSGAASGMKKVIARVKSCRWFIESTNQDAATLLLNADQLQGVMGVSKTLARKSSIFASKQLFDASCSTNLYCLLAFISLYHLSIARVFQGTTHCPLSLLESHTFSSTTLASGNLGLSREEACGWKGAWA
jgi:hypothetical protein